MKELKGTKTEKNLMEAFAGESMARNKYTYFASKAKKDGYVQISAIFEETANNEKEHAKMWFKYLEGGKVKDTIENLKAAAEGENFEWTDMYERMAKEAEEECSEDEGEKEEEKPEEEEKCEEKEECSDEEEMADKDAKISELENIIMEKDAEIAELKKYKEDKECAERDFAVQQTLEELRECVDEETLECLKAEGLACKLSDIDGWKNKAKALAFDRGSKKEMSTSIWSMAIPKPIAKESTSKWDSI